MLDEIYKCPVCEESLLPKNKVYSCQNNHSFDISRPPYLNLLLANQKKSKDPGDSKDMVVARRRFLDAGNYAPLSKAINNIILDNLMEKIKANILDTGCGEGYYLEELYKNKTKALNCWGFDISKNAIKLAAKRKSPINWSVAGVYDIPIMDERINCILNVFAPVCEEEFNRVLVSGGIVVVVSPGAKHLWELKELLYDDPYLHEEKKNNINQLKLIDKQECDFDLVLNSSEEIYDLISMTPYIWNTNTNKINSVIKQVNSLSTRANFIISVFQKE